MAEREEKQMADAVSPARLLITGAAGRLGTAVRHALGPRYPRLRLTDIRPIPEPEPHAEIVQCDLADAAAVTALLAGVDAVVHLSGYPREAPWPQIMATNILPACNLWEAARAAGTQRIVFASSNHVLGFKGRNEPSDATERPRPDTRYGIGHAFVENLASFHADKYGVRGFAIRVGSFGPEPRDARMLSTWLSPGDLSRLVEIGLHADYHFEIVYGVSRNTRSWWDNRRAEALGYAPADSADDWIARLECKMLGDALADERQGGLYVSNEFAGNPARLTPLFSCS